MLFTQPAINQHLPNKMLKRVAQRAAFKLNQNNHKFIPIIVSKRSLTHGEIDRPEQAYGNGVKYLEQDHLWFRRMLSRLEDHKYTFAQKRIIMDKLIMEGSQHEEIEERYSHPLFKSKVPNSQEIYSKVLAKEQELKTILKAIEKNYDNEPEFNRLSVEAARIMREHMHQEEHEVFPMLERFCSEHEKKDLEDRMRSARPFEPTHPHPYAPNKPISGNKLNQAAGIIDQAIDEIAGRPAQSKL